MRPIRKIVEIRQVLWIQVDRYLVRNWNCIYLLYRQMQVYYRSIVVEK